MSLLGNKVCVVAAAVGHEELCLFSGVALVN